MSSPPTAAGDYAVARLTGEWVYTAGMTPRIDGVLVVTGRIGEEVNQDNGCYAATVATMRALEAAESVVPEGHALTDAVSLTVYLSVAPTFTRLSSVADAASAVLASRFPGTLAPVRAAIGVSMLPGNAPVEVQLIARVT
ncbi:RidA family protein [Salinibacterium sp. SWN1162]|uniref:RidA family protein n=1 Tax=Salinibacterium sp. SWN1162 TaxID=2792053 RepID=UPI0018CD9F1D|nr:RidA family protein [Salinibacterium sp. SWN1162]MBH0008692.1 RidA family protein [Salinibacterium sp. SWN1162]